MTDFLVCAVCGREVQVVPHLVDGFRFRIHTGRLTKWCPGSHRPVEAGRVAFKRGKGVGPYGEGGPIPDPQPSPRVSV